MIATMARWWSKYGAATAVGTFLVLIWAGHLTGWYAITVTAWSVIALAFVANLLYVWPAIRACWRLRESRRPKPRSDR